MASISSGQLIGFCRRVGTSLRSGVDVRRVWEHEERRGSPAYRRAMATILDGVRQGDSINEAMRATEFFPPVTVAMVEIGEHTGKLDEALLRLADHYEHQVKLQRQFLMGIAWPTIELVVAILVVGLLIYVFGAIGSRTGSQPIDITGLGLSGTRGVVIYFLAVGCVLSGIATGVLAVVKGWLGPRPVQWAMQVPLVGRALRHTAMSRLTWSLGMALDAGVDAKRSVELAILATQNPFYLSRTPAVVTTIGRGDPFYQAFRDAQGFPTDFLDEMEAAEISGTLSESLVRMAREYNDRARTALMVLTGVATALIWVTFAAILIALIFRLFFLVYLNPINEALEWTKGS
jgi:type II secretory pathway component PulF